MEMDFVAGIIISLCLVGVYLAGTGIVSILGRLVDSAVASLIVGVLLILIAFYGRF